MRSLVSCSAAIIIACSSLGAVRSEPPSPLDRSVAEAWVPPALPACGIDEAVLRLAQMNKIPIGLESSTLKCVRSWHFSRTPDGMEPINNVTVRQALDRIVALDPVYRWREIDGVTVVRPATSWTDPNNQLNIARQGFTLTNGILLDGAIALGLGGTTREKYFGMPNGDRLWALPINRPISVTFPGGTLADGLTALIRAHGGVGWYALHGGAPKLGVVIGDLDGFQTLSLGLLHLPAGQQN